MRLDRRTVQFQYKSDAEFVFMDTASYDQLHIPESVMGDAALYLKENMEVDVMYSEDEPVTVEMPTFVNLKIVKTDPGVKGDTASGGSKPATVESGAVVQVPLFLQEGVEIRVDTRTGVYVERVK
jgi:elongation factor P